MAGMKKTNDHAEPTKSRTLKNTQKKPTLETATYPAKIQIQFQLTHNTQHVYIDDMRSSKHNIQTHSRTRMFGYRIVMRRKKVTMF